MKNITLDISTQNAWQLLCDAKNDEYSADMQFGSGKVGFPLALFTDGSQSALTIVLRPDGTWTATYEP